MRSLSAGNIAALGLVGFCGAFAIYLVKDLWLHHQYLLASALNVVAIALLIAVRFLAWPDIRVPTLARVSWKSAVIALLATVLAVVARSPTVHV